MNIDDRTSKDIEVITKKITKKLDGYCARVRVEDLPVSVAKEISKQLAKCHVKNIVIENQMEQLSEIVTLRNQGGDRVAFLYCSMIGHYVLPEISTTTDKIESSKAMQGRFDRIILNESEY